MQSKSLFFRFILLGMFCLGLTCVSRAQSDRGAIAGTILDSSGGVVEGAQVTAKGEQTGTVYTGISGPTGGFRIGDVRIGIYRVTVTAQGFKTAEKTAVVVQVNSTSSLEYTLEPGEITQTLTVVADAPSLQTENSELGTVVSTRQIQELPLALNANGQSFLRSVQSFVFLTPGTAGPGTNSDSSSSGIFESKIAGGQNFSTEVLLDGASTARPDSGSAFDQNAPSVEAISEFKVSTSTYSAAFGRTSGGVQSFSTTSGTNSFHGTAFDLLRNDKLDANSWTNNLNGAPKPRDHQNDFGGSLGGPVWVPKLYNGRNKTFFFFSWEQYRNNQGTSNVTTLPTDAERTGDFSALLGAPTGAINPCDGSPILAGQIFDPSTTQTVGGVQCRTAFPGNKITTLSPVAQKVLSFLTVHPNLPGQLNGLVNNFLFTASKPIRDTTMTFRIDQNWGTNNKFFFSYSSRDQEVLNGTPALPPPLDPNFFNSNFTHYTRFGWDRTISGTMFNHLNIGLNRLNNFSKGESVTGQEWNSVLGITGAKGPVFPQFTFQGSPLSIGYQGFSTANDDGNLPNGLIVADSFSWVKGRHTLNFGFDWRSFQFSRLSQANQSPAYTFQNFQTAYTPNNALTGDPFASFLLGVPQEASLQINSVFPRWNSNYYAGYVQDDFKFRKNLTLNLGLRYEVETPRHEAHGAQSVLDLTANNPGTPGTLGAMIYGNKATGADTYYKNVGPRVGFAYAPSKLFGLLDNTVLRGGYSIYYAALTYSDFGNSLTSGTSATPDFKSPDKFTPVQSLDQGFPSFPLPSNAQDPTLKNGGFPDYVAPDYGRPGMVQNWSLEAQHQLATDLILSVAYVGSHSTRLHSNLAQVNTINPQFLSLGTKLNDSVTSPAGQATLASLGVTVPSWFEPLYAGTGNDLVGQLLRPHPNFQSIGTNCCLENIGQSTYNALQAKLERRFRNGLNILASYTYSKTLTNADSSFPTFTGFNSNVFGAQNPYNLKAEKSVSFQDIPHTFVLSYLYELPAGPGKKYFNHGVASKVLGGWQVSGVHRYQNGSPLVINEFATSPNFTGGNYRFSRLPGVPLISPNAWSFNGFGANSGCHENPDGTFIANSTNNFFNCAALLDPNASAALVAQQGYVFGNLPVAFSDIRSPGYINEDFAILKRTYITESQNIIFKLDIPNAFNRHVFGGIDGNPTSATFGVPGGGSHSVLNAARQIQITLRYQF
ncbi:MAG: TonB-dependent receptor [Acidobacteria bacterium]|nr:TonB-dependent receptor [Acidobacteriota bacterium]